MLVKKILWRKKLVTIIIKFIEKSIQTVTRALTQSLDLSTKIMPKKYDTFILYWMLQKDSTKKTAQQLIGRSNTKICAQRKTWLLWIKHIMCVSNTDVHEINEHTKLIDKLAISLCYEKQLESNIKSLRLLSLYDSTKNKKITPSKTYSKKVTHSKTHMVKISFSVCALSKIFCFFCKSKTYSVQTQILACIFLTTNQRRHGFYERKILAIYWFFYS